MVYLSLLIILLIFIACVAGCALVIKNIELKPQTPPARAMSKPEIAAKSLMYWERRGLRTRDFDERSIAANGMRHAMNRLVELRDDYEPEEVKANKPAPLPEGVIDINNAKKTDRYS